MLTRLLAPALVAVASACAAPGPPGTPATMGANAAVATEAPEPQELEPGAAVAAELGYHGPRERAERRPGN